MIQGFMKAVILLQLTFPRERQTKSDHFLSTWKLCCRDSHKTQVWLCFFTLSFLTSFISATPVKGTADLQTCLEPLQGAIEKSDAMVYTPPLNDNCTHKMLRCYMSEFRMILEEEEVTSDYQCIMHFNETLSPEGNCPECEVHPLTTTTLFFKQLKRILQQLTSMN